MSFATVQVRSQALGRHVQYTAILPDPDRHGNGPYPVLYQLHGRSDDHTAWLVHSRLADHVRPLPLLVVMPDGGISGWRNAGVHERYEDFIIQDLMEHVAGTFHVRPGRAAIGGLSMGGGGAMRLGLRHPDLFGSIWSHSSSLLTAAELEAQGVAATDAVTDSVYTLAERLATQPRASLPRIAFDCGVDDRMVEQSRSFHSHLEALGLAHTYREHPGAHTWDYWDRHVVEALVQHAEVLGLKRA